MKLQEIKLKKRHGDIPRITQIVNARRIGDDKKPYSENTIRAMLNGNRTLKGDVETVVVEFYNSINDLQTINK